MRRFALVFVAALALTACGSTSSTKGPGDVYVKFFSSKTPVSEKVALLQDGSKFAATITALSKNPLASRLSAKVSSVTLEGSSKAKVVYTIYLGSAAALKNQTGEALKEKGKWVVGYASLCKLLALEGSTPAACKS